MSGPMRKWTITESPVIGRCETVAMVCREDGSGGLMPVVEDVHPPSHFGVQLRAARFSGSPRSLTLGQAARFLGLSLSQLSGLETGDLTLPDHEWVEMIALVTMERQRMYSMPPTGGDG